MVQNCWSSWKCYLTYNSIVQKKECLSNRKWTYRWEIPSHFPFIYHILIFSPLIPSYLWSLIPFGYSCLLLYHVPTSMLHVYPAFWECINSWVSFYEYMGKRGHRNSRTLLGCCFTSTIFCPLIPTGNFRIIPQNLYKTNNTKEK